jgi:hypothetical protein
MNIKLTCLTITIELTNYIIYSHSLERDLEGFKTEDPSYYDIATTNPPTPMAYFSGQGGHKAECTAFGN